MVERLIIDSSVITIPIAVRDKEDYGKLHDYTLHFDMGDTAIKEAKQRQAETANTLKDIRAKYGSLFDDTSEITDENLDKAISGIAEMLRTQFDADFGDGEYEKISNLSGGNSVVNMMDLYQQVNDFLETKLDRKFAKINQKSANRQQKYLKKHGKR